MAAETGMESTFAPVHFLLEALLSQQGQVDHFPNPFLLKIEFFQYATSSANRKVGGLWQFMH